MEAAIQQLSPVLGSAGVVAVVDLGLVVLLAVVYARIAPQAAIHVEKPKNDDVDNREHSNCWTCTGSSAKSCPMLRSPRCNKHREKGRSKVIDHQRVRFEGTQLSLLLCALGFSVQNKFFSSLFVPLPTSPPPGILPVPLNSRLHLGDRLFKVSHCALLG